MNAMDNTKEKDDSLIAIRGPLGHKSSTINMKSSLKSVSKKL